MSLFERRDNTIVIPLTNPDGSYLGADTITDADYAIFDAQGCRMVFRATLSGGSISVVASGADKVLQIDIPASYCIGGQVPNELKILKDGKWLGVTLSSGKLNFIKTRF